jgi:integrase
MGLRVSELINLKGADIRDGYVNVQRLKGSMRTVQRYVRNPDPLLDEHTGLTELSRVVNEDEILFPMTRSGVWRLMQRAGKLAGLPQHKLHPHALKHSIALASIKSAGIENVRQYLGHKSMSSTGAYLRVTDEAASSAVIGAIA